MEDALRMIAVHTVPVWEDPDHPYHRRPPMPGEVRDDLSVVGWCNVAILQGLEDYGVKRWFVLARDGRAIADHPPVGEF